MRRELEKLRGGSTARDWSRPTRATNKKKKFTFGMGYCLIIIAPFGDAYEKIGTIQRRLAWPLHKDDTLFQSGRPTGLNIYFLLFFDSASCSASLHSLSTAFFFLINSRLLSPVLAQRRYHSDSKNRRFVFYYGAQRAPR